MKKSLRWSRDKKPTGLAGVCCGTMGYSLKMDDIIYAKIEPAMNHSDSRWYWYTLNAEPSVNTCNKATALEICKFQAMGHVKKYLVDIMK